MKKLNQLTIQELLNLLQNLTTKNVETIRINKDEAIELDMKNIDINISQELKAEVYNKIKKLNNENHMYFTLHALLFKFIREYGQKAQVITENQNDTADLIENTPSADENKTESNELQKLKALLQIKIENEEYEGCITIQKKIDQLETQREKYNSQDLTFSGIK